jgi:hypothetical protein
VAASVIALVTALSISLWPRPSTPEVLVMQPVAAAAGDASATVSLTSTATGTRLKVTCTEPTGSYLAPPVGGPAPTDYRLVIFNRAGKSQWPVSWAPAPDFQTSVPSSWAPQNISRIVIQDDQGNAIFQLNR